MGGSSSKNTNVSAPKDSIPLTHMAIPIFGTIDDTQMIYDALFLHDSPNTTGYFLYTPHQLETSKQPQFSHDAILATSTGSDLSNHSFRTKRTKPFATTHRFEVESGNQPSLGKAVLGGRGSLKKQVKENMSNKDSSVGDYSGVNSTYNNNSHSQHQHSNPDNISMMSMGSTNNEVQLSPRHSTQDAGPGSNTTYGNSNNSTKTTTTTTNNNKSSTPATAGIVQNQNASSGQGKIQKDALLLQFFRTSEDNTQNPQDNFHRTYNYIIKDDFTEYYPELSSRVKNVESLAKLSRPELLKTQQALALSLVPIPPEMTSFPSLFGAVFQRLYSIPHIPFFLFAVDSTCVGNIDRLFHHLQLIHLALNSNPGLKQVFAHTTIHVLLLNNLERTDTIRNVNIQLWESDLQHYCTQLGLNNLKTHRLGSLQDINHDGLLDLRRFLDTLLLSYFINQYQPTATPYLLGFSPTAAVGNDQLNDISPHNDDNNGGDSKRTEIDNTGDKLPSSISSAAFGQTSSLANLSKVALGGGGGGISGGGNSSTPITSNRGETSSLGQPQLNQQQSWLSLRKATPYTTPFPSLHSSFLIKPALNRLNSLNGGGHYLVHELHTGRYPFIANLYLTHLFNYQQDCHFFNSKISFIRSPQSMTSSAISHTIAVSSQPLNVQNNALQSNNTAIMNHAGNDSHSTAYQSDELRSTGLSESQDTVGPLNIGLFETNTAHSTRSPVISPFSSSQIQLPQSTYTTSSRRLRELHPTGQPLTMSKSSPMPKTPTKKPTVQFDLHFSADYEPHYERLPALTSFRAPYELQSIVPSTLLKSYEDQLALQQAGRSRGQSSYKKPNNLEDLAIPTIDRARAGTVMKDSAVKEEVTELMLHSYNVTPIYSSFLSQAPLTAQVTCVPYLATFNVFFINLSSLTVLKQSPGELWRGVKTAFAKLLSNVHAIFIPTKVLFFTGDLLQLPLTEVNDIHSQQQQQRQLIAQTQGKDNDKKKEFPSQLTKDYLDSLISKQEGIIMSKLKPKLDQLGSFQRQLWDFDRVDEQSLMFTLHQFEQTAVLRRLDLLYSYSLIQHPGSAAAATAGAGSTTTASGTTSPGGRDTFSIQPLEFLNSNADDTQALTPRNQSRSVY